MHRGCAEPGPASAWRQGEDGPPGCADACTTASFRRSHGLLGSRSGGGRDARPHPCPRGNKGKRASGAAAVGSIPATARSGLRGTESTMDAGTFSLARGTEVRESRPADCAAGIRRCGLQRTRASVPPGDANPHEAVEGWSLRLAFEPLRTLRGVDVLTAATVLAELGDPSRFDNPRQLVAFLGLVPSEHSSGSRRRQGAITKTGNAHVRRVLIESAWCYRFPARKTAHLRQTGADASPEVQGRRVESAKAPVRALPAPQRHRQAHLQSHHRSRAGTGRLHVG